MTLDELRTVAALLPPGASLSLTRESLLETLSAASNGGTSNGARPVSVASADSWLKAEEAAKRLGVSVRWCYDHAETLGAKRLSRRCVRFPEAAVERYMARRR